MSTKRSYESIFPYLLPMVLISLTLISGTALSSSSASADDSVVSTTTITVPVSCSIIGTTTTTHTAEIPNGIDSRSNDYYPDGIGTTTVKAYCNDNEGFAIYAVGYTGDIIGNTYLRDSTLGQTSDIQTSTTFSGANSAWAMKIGVTNGTYPSIVAGSAADSEKQSGDLDYSTWQAVPSTYTRVAYRNSATDVNTNSIASAEGSSVTTTYAAYISPTQNSGTYIGQVKYTLVHPSNEIPLQPITCSPGKICYGPNGSNVVGTMGQQNLKMEKDWSQCDFTDYISYCEDEEGQEIDISTLPEIGDYLDTITLASNFSRDGYGFAGWNDEYDYSGNFYGPNDTIAISDDYISNGLSLYAVWIKSQGIMQDASTVTSVCNNLTQATINGAKSISNVGALTDARDNDTYAVARLADGNCWMIENLRLDNNDSIGENASLSQGYNDSFIGLANPEMPWGDYNTSANSLYSTNGSTVKTISGGSSAYQYPRYNNQNTASRADNPTVLNANLYGYGNYYTWPAAIADTTYYTVNNVSIGNTSICPTGWRLPIGGDKTNELNNEIWALFVTMFNSGVKPANYSSASQPSFKGISTISPISQTIRSYPNNFVYSGYSRDVISFRGLSGHYITSTTRSGYDSYDYDFGYFQNEWQVVPGDYAGTKYIGRVVRCIASTPAP